MPRVADPAHHLGAAAAGQVHVEQHHVRAERERRRRPPRRRRRPRRPPRRVGELGADAGAEHRVVVDDHDGASSWAWSSALLVPRWSSTAAPRCPSPGAVRIVGGAAVARHPVHDAVAHAEPVARDRLAVEAGAAVADEHLQAGRPPPRRRRRPARRPRACAALTIASRAASTSGRSRSSRGTSPTVTTSTGTPCASSTSAATRRRAPATEVSAGVARRRTARSAGRAPAPGRAGPPCGRRRRASGSARASAAPSRAGARPRRRAPGCAPARRAPRRGRRRAGTATGPTVRARPTTPSAPATSTSRATPAWPLCAANSTSADSSSPTPAASRAHDATPPRPTTARSGSIRPVASDPALALRLVGLAPQHGQAEQAEQQRPEQHGAADDALHQDDHAERDRRQRDERTDVLEPATRSVGRSALARGRLQPGSGRGEPGVGGQDHPEAGVHRHAEPAERRGDHEGAADQHHVHAQVVGEAGAHPAEQAVAGAPGGPAGLVGRGRRGGTVCGFMVASIVTQRVSTDHEFRP